MGLYLRSSKLEARRPKPANRPRQHCFQGVGGSSFDSTSVAWVASAATSPLRLKRDPTALTPPTAAPLMADPPRFAAVRARASSGMPSPSRSTERKTSTTSLAVFHALSPNPDTFSAADCNALVAREGSTVPFSGFSKSRSISGNPAGVEGKAIREALTTSRPNVKLPTPPTTAPRPNGIALPRVPAPNLALAFSASRASTVASGASAESGSC